MQRIIIVTAAILTAIVLAGCRQEQDHPLVTGNGNYTGPAPQELTSSQVNALNSRIALQGEANVSAGAAVRPAEERPAPPTSAELDKRLKEQAGLVGPDAKAK
jgi:outer membrane murein-binding lipoprotein Lpp